MSSGYWTQGNKTGQKALSPQILESTPFAGRQDSSPKLPIAQEAMSHWHGCDSPHPFADSTYSSGLEGHGLEEMQGFWLAKTTAFVFRLNPNFCHVKSRWLMSTHETWQLFCRGRVTVPVCSERLLNLGRRENTGTTSEWQEPPRAAPPRQSWHGVQARSALCWGSVLGCEGRACPLSLMGSSSAQLSLFDNFIINLFINSSTAVRKRKQGLILMPDFWKSHSTRHRTVWKFVKRVLCQERQHLQDKHKAGTPTLKRQTSLRMPTTWNPQMSTSFTDKGEHKGLTGELTNILATSFQASLKKMPYRRPSKPNLSHDYVTPIVEQRLRWKSAGVLRALQNRDAWIIQATYFQHEIC